MDFDTAKEVNDNRLQLSVNTMPSFMCPIIRHFHLM